MVLYYRLAAGASEAYWPQARVDFRMGHGVSSCEADDIKEVLALVEDLKKRGVAGGSVARSFCRRLIQLIKDRVHPAYEYWGQSDPTRASFLCFFF
jgi:hypothetical protein